ncbi:teichuronic acid biosynthesis glycosyltransferase TuaC [Peribacillus deserti]|uniref:Teichuronic acid biosynthesis glycosyltransferase TuaC n=1 Tax=Peribacillus deserti TaxID=673318 RepID=A0ABS2QCQ1_9BACI|nr:glycosyltransferase [Peribacillus deserti]MBM7690810.1 teichuronic acid biosynthesis glycosyltransferase TuaC [Peribacillus deserti]
MKVLWITSVYPSSEQPGCGVFHETQVQALVRLGIEVTVICPVPRNPAVIQYMKKQYRANKHIPLIYERKGVTVYRPPYTALPGQLRWAQPDKRIAAAVLETMAEHNMEPDLIHAHFAMPSGGAAKRVAEVKNLPWILTLHGSDVNVYPHYSKGAMKAFLQSIRLADEVVSVGSNLKEKAKDLSGRDSTVLPIGVDLSRFQLPKQFKLEVRRQLGLPLDKKIVLFVGRLMEAKGVFELAKALESLPEEVAAAYVGDGPAYEKLNSHPQFNKRIFLTGQVENSKVKDYLFASDVFALPSYREGMPTVVIEALALKVPVICTAVGGMTELFGQHSKLLIEPKSAASLSERISDYLYRDINLTKIGQELYSHIQEHYDASKNASVLRDIYQRLLKSDGRLSKNTK